MGSDQHTACTVSTGTEPLILSRPGWYAIQTRARHEKRIGAELQEKGIVAFVPTIRSAHRWSDRTKMVEVPMFSCYVFVNMVPTAEHRLEVLKTMGVFRFVSVNGYPASIPDVQIESIQTVLANKLPVAACGFTLGQRVRISGGCLHGVEGVLTGSRGDRKLVISVDLLQQSVSVVADDYTLEAA